MTKTVQKLHNVFNSLANLLLCLGCGSKLLLVTLDLIHVPTVGETTWRATLIKSYFVVLFCKMCSSTILPHPYIITMFEHL